MKIEKYTKLKGNRYNVKIDGEDVKLYDDVIVKYELLRTKEIDEKLFAEIKKYNDELDAYYKSIKYITRRMRTEKEVEDYLRNDYSRKTITETISRLKEDGFLNKELYLKSYFNDEINLGSYGPNKIKNNLIKLGYSEDDINAKLNEINDEIWLEKLEKLVKKRMVSNKSYGISKLKEKILYDLSNLGYYKWMIEDVIKRSEFTSNDDILDKEYRKAYNKLSKKYSGYELENKIMAKLVSKGFYYEEIKEIINTNY